MKTRTPEQKERTRLERFISKTVSEVLGLTFGYIGNFESWGDDRLLIIWIQDPYGANKKLWECKAKSLTSAATSSALCAIKGFKAGFSYSRDHFKDSHICH